jgi:hypothetical protein
VSSLPEQFAELEPFVNRWSLASESERYAQRLGSTMDEMQTFYDAIVPRADEAMTYLEQFPLDGLPNDALDLLHLVYSMIQVSFPVEVWRQPRVPDTGSATFDCITEPVP